MKPAQLDSNPLLFLCAIQIDNKFLKQIWQTRTFMTCYNILNTLLIKSFNKLITLNVNKYFSSILWPIVTFITPSRISRLLKVYYSEKLENKSAQQRYENYQYYLHFLEIFPKLQLLRADKCPLLIGMVPFYLNKAITLNIAS